MTGVWTTCVGVVLCAAVLWVMFRLVVAVTSMDTKVLPTVSALRTCKADANERQCPVSEEESHITTLNEMLNCPKMFPSLHVTNSLLKKEHERYRKRRGKMTDVKSDDNNTERKVTRADDTIRETITRADDKLEDRAGVTTADTGHYGHLPATGLVITYHDNSGKQKLKKVQITESQCKKFADSRRRRKKGGVAS